MSSSRPNHVTWIIGSGGLLGTALTARLRSRADGIVLTSRVPWPNPAAVRPALADGVAALAAAAAEHGCPWRVAWCAGAGVTGTSDHDLDQEVATFTDFLADLGSVPPGPGALFLSSSAGGLYAGSSGAPYTEHHPVSPISAYGHAKLAAETAARAYASATDTAVLIGRIANLYGPGQNLGKGQGLISHLCRANLSRQPVSVYVSLDTVRDYLYVDDCAGMIADLLDRAVESAPAGPALVKILASQQGTTIGALIGECRRVFKRAPRLVLGTSRNAKFQVRDLRLRSVVWPEIDRRALTPLPAGIAATAAGLLRSAQLTRC